MNKFNQDKIKSFTDLDAWKKAYGIALEIYAITAKFPKEEIFGIVSQMRRCVVSITSNIAEGFSRKTFGEKIQFYSMAQGSVTELQNQLIISRGVRYLNQDDFHNIAAKMIVLHKIISGLIKKSKSYNIHS